MSTEVRLREERVSWRTGGIALGVTLIGAGLLYITSIDELWMRHRTIQHVTEKIADLIFATGLLSVLWEFLHRRFFLDEILAKTGVAREIRAAGIVQVLPNFKAGIDWPKLFENARELDILVSYARTWRNEHLEQVRVFVSRPGNRLRLVLPDPANASNLAALGQRYAISPDEARTRIEETITVFRGLGANVEIWAMATPPMYSLYRFDATAVLSIYNHQVDRSPVPAVILERGGTLYESVIADLNKLFNDAARCRRLFLNP